MIFLISVFCFGLILKIFLSDKPAISDTNYNLNMHDSAFFNALNADSLRDLSEKNLASEQELLDFSTNELSKNSPVNSLLSEHSINLNSAEISELKKLPGIGEKTAERIIEMRKMIGKYSSIDQLLEVKGIGSKKLNKIKKYIFLSD